MKCCRKIWWKIWWIWNWISWKARVNEQSISFSLPKLILKATIIVSIVGTRTLIRVAHPRQWRSDKLCFPTLNGERGCVWANGLWHWLQCDCGSSFWIIRSLWFYNRSLFCPSPKYQSDPTWCYVQWFWRGQQWLRYCHVFDNWYHLCQVWCHMTSFDPPY